MGFSDWFSIIDGESLKKIDDLPQSTMPLMNGKDDEEEEDVDYDSDGYVIDKEVENRNITKKNSLELKMSTTSNLEAGSAISQEDESEQPRKPKNSLYEHEARNSKKSLGFKKPVSSNLQSRLAMFQKNLNKEVSRNDSNTLSKLAQKKKAEKAKAELKAVKELENVSQSQTEPRKDSNSNKKQEEKTVTTKNETTVTDDTTKERKDEKQENKVAGDPTENATTENAADDVSKESNKENEDNKDNDLKEEATDKTETVDKDEDQGRDQDTTENVDKNADDNIEENTDSQKNENENNDENENDNPSDSKEVAKSSGRMSVREKALLKLQEKQQAEANNKDVEKLGKRKPSSKLMNRWQQVQESQESWKKNYFAKKSTTDDNTENLQFKSIMEENRKRLLTESEDQWKKEYFAKKSMTDEHGDLSFQKVIRENRQKLLSNETEEQWKKNYYSKGDGDVYTSEIEQLKNQDTSKLVSDNINKFTKVISGDYEEDIKKVKQNKEEHLALLHLQIRKLNENNKMNYLQTVENANKVFTNVEHGVTPRDEELNSMEMDFQQRLTDYQTELLDLQKRFEDRIAWFKDIRHDGEDDIGLDDAAKEQAIKIMQEQILKRKTKYADQSLMDAATKEMNRENAFRVLRDLDVLLENDTVINLNSTEIFLKLSDKKVKLLKDCIMWCIADNPRLMSLQMANVQMDDKWLSEVLDILMNSHNSQMLTELVLESNPITDKGIEMLSKYIELNPPCLRVLKLGNLWSDITTPMMNHFLKALNKNTQLVKVTMDVRFYQHRDKISKITNRNFKRYAQERRLKRTLLATIQTLPSKTAPTVGDDNDEKDNDNKDDTKSKNENTNEDAKEEDDDDDGDDDKSDETDEDDEDDEEDDGSDSPIVLNNHSTEDNDDVESEDENENENDNKNDIEVEVIDFDDTDTNIDKNDLDGY